MAMNSFKPSSLDPRFRSPTPERPLVEPITPPRVRATPLPTRNEVSHESENDGIRRDGTTDRKYDKATHRASSPVNAPAEAFAQSARPASSHARPHGSPIDTLADIASSIAPTSLFPPEPRRSSYSQVSPTASAQPSRLVNEQRATYTYDNRFIDGADERPAKRARSEIFASSQHVQYTQKSSRPSTSYAGPQSFMPGAEQGSDGGTRVYTGLGPSSSTYIAHDSAADRLSEAQLLLDFMSSANSRLPSTVPSSGYHPTIQIHQPPEYTSSNLPADQPRYLPQDGVGRQQGGSVQSGGQLRIQTLESMHDSHPANSHSAVEESLQTRTPPEDVFKANAVGSQESIGKAQASKAKPHGWPRAKSKGTRQRKGSKPKSSHSNAQQPSNMSTDIPDQLQSPQSLPAGTSESTSVGEADAVNTFEQVPMPKLRRHSATEGMLSAQSAAERTSRGPTCSGSRASSVPAATVMAARESATETTSNPVSKTRDTADAEPEAVTICAGCHFSSNSLSGESRHWINCDGCKGWFHFACAGFLNERDVRNVDKFFCWNCKAAGRGQTTYVRRTGRAHAAVDYASLHEGSLRTSDDNPEHHYIQFIKDGTLSFTPEAFPRMRPELVTLENLERGGFNDPIVIPAMWNPRPPLPGTAPRGPLHPSSTEEGPVDFEDDFEHEYVPDDGQDKLDMVIPQGLTVRRVAELYGPDEKVEVIDVKSQEGEDKRWNMRRWADYYEQEGEKVVRNVISLEVSMSKLGRLIRRPKVVRDMDLMDAVWPEADKAKGDYPKVQFYCLMSVADCYTDFHIDFGGSSVYYHIVKGKKTFFFIPPTKQNLKKYEQWCLSPAQNWTFLGNQVKECFRVDLSEGDTMLIPSGWIHAVWTPENSLVIGGNFLTPLHYGMQLQIFEIEKATKVARKFRYPNFQKVLWYTVLKYLNEDALPQKVSELFCEGRQFPRETPIYLQFDKFGHNSDPGPENYNARYYSKAELDGLWDLARYIFRTVMIHMGKVENITSEVRTSVSRSIPKSVRDPLEVIKAFAMWVAWKRGNENIPEWAHPDALLPEIGELKTTKKHSAATLRKMERKAFIEAYRVAPDRQSARQRNKAQEASTNGTSVNGESPTPQRATVVAQKHLSTPKTSQLGPKRIACDNCRKRRIRCKHKDELAASQGVNGNKMVAVVIPPLQHDGQTTQASAGHRASLGDVQSFIDGNILPTDGIMDASDHKRGRTKACNDCRKSKRRCIHDEFGNIDPIKAQEAPVPRGSVSSKKRRVSEGEYAHTSKKARMLPPPPFSDANHAEGEIKDNIFAGPSFGPSMQGAAPGFEGTSQPPAEDQPMLDSEPIMRDAQVPQEQIKELQQQAILAEQLQAHAHAAIHTVEAVSQASPAAPEASDHRDVSTDPEYPRQEHSTAQTTSELPYPQGELVQKGLDSPIIATSAPMLSTEGHQQQDTPRIDADDHADSARDGRRSSPLSEPPKSPSSPSPSSRAHEANENRPAEASSRVPEQASPASPKTPFRHSSRQSKPVERYTAEAYEHHPPQSTSSRRRSAHTPSRAVKFGYRGKQQSPTNSHSPLLSKKRDSKSEASGKADRRRSRAVSGGAASMSPGATGGVKTETDEQASLKLAMALAGQEFGLRSRRS